MPSFRCQDPLGLNDFKGKRNIINLLKALLAEFIGTLILVFLGCGTATKSLKLMEDQLKDAKNRTNGDGVPIPAAVIHISLAFGFAVTCIAVGLGHVSGGHVNPAVTVGFLATGKIKIIRGLLYVVVQHIGAIVGAGILEAAVPGTPLGANMLLEGVGVAGGFIMEFTATFVLVLIVCGCCDPGRHDIHGSIPLIVGLTVAVGHLLTIGYTTCGINPARSIAPVVISPKNATKDFWIYIVAPYLGGLLGAVLYWLLFQAADLAAVPAEEPEKTPSTAPMVANKVPDEEGEAVADSSGNIES